MRFIFCCLLLITIMVLTVIGGGFLLKFAFGLPLWIGGLGTMILLMGAAALLIFMTSKIE